MSGGLQEGDLWHGFFFRGARVVHYVLMPLERQFNGGLVAMSEAFEQAAEVRSPRMRTQ